MSIPKLHKQHTSRLDNRETPDTIQSAKQERSRRSRRSIALYNNRIFTEEKNNIRVQFLLTSASSARLMRKTPDFSALWNDLETKKESVHSRNSLGDHTLSFRINGETSVGILQQPLLVP